MKREEIEKVSKEYAWTGDMYNLEDAFKAGANWRINSIWHNAVKKPTKKKIIVVIKDDGCICQISFMVGVDDWEGFVNDCGIIKWAYKEDLIPNTEE